MSADETDTLQAMRVDYRHASLDEKDVRADALEQFAHWFKDSETAKLPEPNAMTLATASADGTPSARIVLLKGFDERGFVFYSNYESRKGRELEVNPRVALVFFWEPLERQVRIEGAAQRISHEESKAYFDVRPRASRIGAWASNQSAVIASRAVIEAREQELDRKFHEEHGEDIPLPDFWGGYRVIPAVIEFWQGRPGRLHDRLRYSRDGNGWKIDRLSP